MKKALALLMTLMLILAAALPALAEGENMPDQIASATKKNGRQTPGGNQDSQQIPDNQEGLQIPEIQDGQQFPANQNGQQIPGRGQYRSIPQPGGKADLFQAGASEKG